MPNRWVGLLIVGFWAVMVALLIERDIVPHWRMRQRPDFQAVAQIDSQARPVRWAILLADEQIGSAETEWVKLADGWTEFRSQVEFKQLPFATSALPGAGGTGLRWTSALALNPERNLHHFDVQVFWGESKPTMTVHGKLEGEVIRVVFRAGALTHEEQFYYEPQSLVTISLTPIDRLPNLSVGQEWQHHVMNPVFHTTETVQCRVTSEQVITWNGNPVPTYVVEQTHRQMRARCWVAYDGTVLRQEVPMGTTPLVLEHQ